MPVITNMKMKIIGKGLNVTKEIKAKFLSCYVN